MPPILEKKFDIIQEAGLIAFDGKVIMSSPINNVSGNAALVQ
jgi:hypothetical protein